MRQNLLLALSTVVLAPASLVMAQVLRAAHPVKSFQPSHHVHKTRLRTAASAATALVGAEAIADNRRMIISFKWSFLGRKALNHSDYIYAERCFRQALTSYPRSDEARTGLAQALEGEGKDDEANTAYSDTFSSASPLSTYSTYPTDIAALAQHGLLAEKDGQQQEAVKAYNMTRQWLKTKMPVPLLAEFDPKGPPAPQLLAMLETIRGVALMDAKNQDGRDRSAEALIVFRDAAQRLPSDARMQYYLGYGYQNVGRLIEARAAFEKAARLDTEGPVKVAAEKASQAVMQSKQRAAEGT